MKKNNKNNTMRFKINFKNFKCTKIFYTILVTVCFLFVSMYFYFVHDPRTGICNRLARSLNSELRSFSKFITIKHSEFNKENECCEIWIHNSDAIHLSETIEFTCIGKDKYEADVFSRYFKTTIESNHTQKEIIHIGVDTKHIVFSNLKLWQHKTLTDIAEEIDALLRKNPEMKRYYNPKIENLKQLYFETQKKQKEKNINNLFDSTAEKLMKKHGLIK